MILPAISLDVAAKDISLLTSLAVVGDVLLTPGPQGQIQDPSPLLEAASCWVQLPSDSTVDTALDYLHAGAAKVVVSAAADYVTSLLQQVSSDRIILSVELDGASPATAITAEAFGYLFTVSTAADDQNYVKTIRELTASFTSSRIYWNTPSVPPTLAAIAAWDKHDINLVVPSTHLSTSGSSLNTLDLGEAFAASLTSDRPDGLFATIVVDEQRVALGLCYSSVKSISEAIRTQTGVYQSRARGLWYKGASSGATQKLVKITYDCDKDTLQFIVTQEGPGFCHLNTRTCFGADSGITALEALLRSRKAAAPQGSYTRRLFEDPVLLHSKIMEEADELVEATSKADIAWETADLIYFALTKCVANGVSLADIEKQLDKRAKAVKRRAGNAKPKWDLSLKQNGATKQAPAATAPAQNATAVAKTETKVERKKQIVMKTYSYADTSDSEKESLLLRPIIKTEEILARVKPIVDEVRSRGDAALLDLTAKFDGVKLQSSVIKAPFPAGSMTLSKKVQDAIDQAYDNIYKFHDAQLDKSVLRVETMPGVVCTRFFRAIEKVGLYVPGGTAVLPSSTLMLGVPALVAGCKEIVIATPPRKDGTVPPEVVYVANKVGASTILIAGGAQAVAAMAYGTDTVPKVDKICGPGNQYVTAAKMVAQSDSSAMVSIDMPAGPSELLVIADATCNPAYVASDLLSQAEHGPDSQVVLLAVDLKPELLAAIEDEVKTQGEALPRSDIVRESIPKSYIMKMDTMQQAMDFSNKYAPEHLILHLDDAERWVEKVQNAGSVFVGPWSPESCGDYASGTNHTLPTYGYARMYSGVNTLTFVKHITSQTLTKEGLDRLGDTVTTLAEVEGLEAHRNAVAIRLKDIRKGRE
ncbi:histidinol dehydrogenase-domain-containing protein [Powellomyces hirtus]|nr:histidinol dehydrogenase-domain-containing protein [Powellomyces hirtus]